MMLDQSDGVLYDRGEVNLVPLGLVLCEDDVLCATSKCCENANTRAHSITEPHGVYLMFGSY